MERLEAIKESMRDRGRLAVLFSGGLDSTFLVWLAHEALGDEAKALTFRSPIIHEEDALEARMLSDLIGIDCEDLFIDELGADPAFSLNPADRCYLCRKIRDREARQWADKKGIEIIADGLNSSDFGDYRPGMRASREDGIWQPFVEFNFTKDEIRAYSRHVGLPTWDKPNTVCLCSRIPFGIEITGERLRRVEKAETFLKRLGFITCRARYFPLETAVVEIDDMDRAMKHKGEIVTVLRDLGFQFVTLDLEGFASGKLNRTLHRGSDK